MSQSRTRRATDASTPTLQGWGSCAMNQTESTFLQNTVPAAQTAQRSYGVPASIMLAQATLESQWGQSALAKQANNFFGIHADAKVDPSKYIEFTTDEMVDGRQTQGMARFARFASPVFSFTAHAYLLSMALRYRTAMQVKSDPTNFAFALQNCGYSTDPNYGNKLMQIVQQFDLTQYDVASAVAGPVPAPQTAKVVASAGISASTKATVPAVKTPASTSVVNVTPAAPAKVKP